MKGPIEIAFRGAVEALSGADRARLFRRSSTIDPSVRERASEIVREVRERGDEALFELAERLDGVSLEALEVSAADRATALEAIDPQLRAALERARDAIERVHRDQLIPNSRSRPAPGVEVGRRSVPLRRIGAYAPGGRAAYPSSVLMCVVPARVAGVDEVVVCSPPGPDGRPSSVVMAACEIAGADRLFALGGAGAVAALAYGTASVPAVDKIVGPGNVWVEEAKLAVHRDVAIDCPAGPSEVLVIADDEADPGRVAAELLAQAEHDVDARVALISPSAELVEAVERELARQLEALPTAATARDALAGAGALLTCGDLEAALELSEAYAPEHLLLAGSRAGTLADRVRNAGSLFFGPGASVAFGDYASGGNHVLPTGGRARAWSGLGVRDFQRELSWQRFELRGAVELADTVEAIANAEGLPGHAAAARATAEGDRPDTPADTDDPSCSTPPAHRAVPAGIRATRRYAPGRRDCAVELSDNTNLFGSAPSALAVLRSGPEPSLRRYPTVYGDRLKEALADWLGVSPENVATGCGSDDLLDSAFHAFAGGAGTIAYSDPTFSMVRAFGTMNDADLLALPTGADLRPDLEGLAAAGADLIYLCRPDNPSGRVVPESELMELLEGRRASTLVLDEAYAAFMEEPSLAPRAPGLPGLVVLGTFSKAWGMAGLRIGYAVADADTIDLIERARGPYKLNALAEAAASAALDSDRGWLADTVRDSIEARERLRERLRQRGLEVLPSGANFLLVRVDDADAVTKALRDRDVGVRPFVGIPGGDAIRVTAGPEPLMEAFLEAFDAAVLDRQDDASAGEGA